MISISKSNCLIVLIIALLTCSCSASVLDIEGAFDEVEAKNVEICGFGSGISHGIALPLTTIRLGISYITGGDTTVAMWASLRNGFPYWAGYALGNLIIVFLLTLIVHAIFGGRMVLFENRTNTFIILFVPCVFVYFAAILAGNIPKPKVPELNEEQVLSVLSYKSPEDGAYYYVHRREYYDFFDELYCDKVIPVLLEGEYRDAKEVMRIISGTPAGDVFEPLFLEMKYNYQNYLYDQLDKMTSSLKESYERDIQSLLPVIVDSVLTESSKFIVNEYAGGFLNYKKIGLFFSSDNFKRFERIALNSLEKRIVEQEIDKVCSRYFQSMVDNYSDCHLSLFGDSLIINIPQLPSCVEIIPEFGVMETEINTYSREEGNEYMVAVFKDGIIPIAMIPLTGGVGTAIAVGYDLATFGYDAYECYRDIANMELSFEEKMELYIASNIKDMLHIKTDAINTLVCSYFDECDKLMRAEIAERI